MSKNNIAAIDSGTNSCRILISSPDGTTVYRDAISTRMGAGMSKNNYFTDEAISRGIECFCEFKMFMDQYNVQKYRAIATAACRTAKNGAEFIDKVKQQANIDIEVIDGYEEARLNLRGAALNVKDENTKYIVVYDLGGGSTEITLATNESTPKILHTVSIPWGARNSAEKFELNDYDEIKSKKLADEISKYSKQFVIDAKLDNYKDKTSFIATSSTSLRLTHIVKNWNSYDILKADGIKVDVNEFDRVINDIRKTNYNERLNHPCIGPSRADIFNSACVIFSQIYKDLGAKEITTSLKAAIDGIIMELQNAAD